MGAAMLAIRSPCLLARTNVDWRRSSASARSPVSMRASLISAAAEEEASVSQPWLADPDSMPITSTSA